MAVVFTVRNRQQRQPVDLGLLKRIISVLLKDLLHITQADLGFVLVAGPEIKRLNETFLQHAGATDVIAFDYAEDFLDQTSSVSCRTGIGKMPVPRPRLHGEVFVCVDEAIVQARRFHTSWQSEVVRYIVHGVLHLLGHDDGCAADRQRMKREEDRLCAKLAARFPLSRLARKPRLRA